MPESQQTEKTTTEILSALNSAYTSGQTADAGNTLPKTPHLVYVVTSSITADFLLRGQLKHMRQQGWKVTLVCAPGERLSEVAKRENVDLEMVPMLRQPSPMHDLVAVIRMIRTLKRLRPDIINYGTPKAALLAAIASWWVRIPVRIYLLRGLRCEGATGFARWIFLATEQITSWCSTNILCVSRSLLSKAVELKAIDTTKAVVLGNGSSNGVDCERFQASADVLARGRKLRESMDIPQEDLIIGFVGRIVRDKGISELITAYEQIREEYPRCRLLLVGPKEVGDSISDDTRRRIEIDPRIHWLGKSLDTPAAYAAMDIVALPTHREGFPNVALEAASMGKPMVVTRATGAVDAVQDGETAITVEVGDSHAIAIALGRYLGDAELRTRHGQSGRKRVVSDFTSLHIWQRLEAHYRALITEPMT